MKVSKLQVKLDWGRLDCGHRTAILVQLYETKGRTNLLFQTGRKYSGTPCSKLRIGSAGVLKTRVLILSTDQSEPSDCTAHSPQACLMPGLLGPLWHYAHSDPSLSSETANKEASKKLRHGIFIMHAGTVNQTQGFWWFWQESELSRVYLKE